MTLPPGWSEDRIASLVEALGRETPPGHVLHAVPVTALARRRDRDDVLYRIDDGTSRVALVHLSYVEQHDPRWPATTLFASEAAWLASVMDDDARSDD